MKIKLEDGKIIERVPRNFMCGNFCMCVVRYKNFDYLLSELDGDEYLRDEDDAPEYYTLGKKLGVNEIELKKLVICDWCGEVYDSTLFCCPRCQQQDYTEKET